MRRSLCTRHTHTNMYEPVWAGPCLTAFQLRVNHGAHAVVFWVSHDNKMMLDLDSCFGWLIDWWAFRTVDVSESCWLWCFGYLKNGLIQNLTVKWPVKWVLVHFLKTFMPEFTLTDNVECGASMWLLSKLHPADLCTHITTVCTQRCLFFLLPENVVIFLIAGSDVWYLQHHH